MAELQVGAHARLVDGESMYFIGSDATPVEEVDAWLASHGLRKFSEHVEAAARVPNALFLTWKSTNCNALAAFVREDERPEIALQWLMNVDDAGGFTVEPPCEEDVRLGCRVIEHYRDDDARSIVFCIASDRNSRIVARRTSSGWYAGCEVQVAGESGTTPLWCHYVFMDIPQGAVQPQRAYALVEDMEGRLYVVTRRVKVSISDVIENAIA